MADQLTLDGGGVTRGAVISECGQYRYELTRIWDPTGPLLEFIGLNPSKADGSIDDNTIRRMVAFAKRWGYGGIVVRNLFALRATHPQVLLNHSLLGKPIGRGRAVIGDAFGPRNFEHLGKTDADCTIAAWGSHVAAQQWFAAGLRLKRVRLFCLGTNYGGSPKHPLYVPSSRTPIPWEVPA